MRIYFSEIFYYKKLIPIQLCMMNDTLFEERIVLGYKRS